MKKVGSDYVALPTIMSLAAFLEEAVIVTDHDGKVTWINQACTELCGFTLEEMEGKIPGQLLQGPETDSKTTGQISQAIRRRKPIQVDILNYHKSGYTYWADLSIFPLFTHQNTCEYFISIARERTEMNGELLKAIQAQRLLETLINHYPNGSLSLLNPKLKVLFTGGEGYLHSDIEPRRLIGKDMDAFVSREIVDKLKASLSGLRKGESITHEARYQEKYFINRYAPVFDQQGKLEFIIITSDNITNIKAYQKELIEAKKEAEQANEAKSSFLANMSHEIRTPLNGIVGFSDILMRAQLKGEQKEYLAAIHQSAYALLDIISDILDFSKIEAGKIELDFEEMNLLDVVKQSTSHVAYQSKKKNLKLSVDIKTDVPNFIVADQVRLRQILVNLLGNAIKFTEQGEVILKVELLERIDPNGAKLRFSVTDTGIGISPEHQERIFEDFVQADLSISKRFGGSGLGLSISNKLLRLMQSNLALKSKLGQGSTFYFDVTVRTHEGDKFFWQQMEGLGNVLLVHRDNQSSEDMEQMLAGKASRIEKAKNGVEAIQTLKQNAFDLVIIAYELPYINGVETIRYLIENHWKNEGRPYILMIMPEEHDDLDIAACHSVGIRNLLQEPYTENTLYKGLIGAYQEKTKNGNSIKNGYIHFDTILIVEDQEINALLAKTMMESLCPTAQTLIAKNGEEALDIFKSSNPSIILMDIQLPVTNGYDLTKEIRKLEKKDERIPIIALTADALSGEMERCLAAGMDDYMSKPITQAKLRQVLGKWQTEEPDQAITEAELFEDQEYKHLKHYNERLLFEKLKNEQMVEEVLEKVRLNMLESGFSKLWPHFQNHSKKELMSASHALRGSANNIGFEVLATLLLSLEKMKPFQWQKAEAILQKVEKELKLLKKILK